MKKKTFEFYALLIFIKVMPFFSRSQNISCLYNGSPVNKNILEIDYGAFNTDNGRQCKMKQCYQWRNATYLLEGIRVYRVVKCLTQIYTVSQRIKRSTCKVRFQNSYCTSFRWQLMSLEYISLLFKDLENEGKAYLLSVICMVHNIIFDIWPWVLKRLPYLHIRWWITDL